ncbi:MAG: ATP-binding protein [Byssovorax sp.]
MASAETPLRFVDRVREIGFLNGALRRTHPGPGQLLLVYGRRRVGKSKLLLRWAEQSRVGSTYWVAEKEGPALQRRKLYAKLMGVPVRQAPLFESWAELWDAVAALLEGRRHILILDELPYASEADPAMLSALQHAWDTHFQRSKVVLALCGSQVRTMEALQLEQSPLFGRLTGRWHVEPLPYCALGAFLPGWSAEDRVAAYAVVGGIPAYLEWLDPRWSLAENLRRVVLSPGSMFSAEPAFLLYDEVREPQNYLSVLGAVGAGNHSLDEIARATLIEKAHLSSYLVRLQELRLVERRLPVTLSPSELRKSRRGRYHLSDAYFRFYFRFIAPYQSTLSFEASRVAADIQGGLNAFVGATAFEDLARQWLVRKGRAGELPFKPDAVGSHWGAKVQADVVAICARSRDILIGECKWTVAPVDEQDIRKLVEETAPRVLQDLPGGGAGWVVHHAAFARSGFTRGARAAMKKRGGILIGLDQLDEALSEE